MSNKHPIFGKLGRCCLIVLIMSLFTILFGCKDKKQQEAKTVESPRFPATDHPDVQFSPVSLDGFNAQAFYITADKQSVFVLGAKDPDLEQKQEEGYEPQPRQFERIDYRIFYLDSNGAIKYHHDILQTDWLDGGSFGMLEGEFMLRIGDFFLVLDPKTLDVLEKIPVHDPTYVSWKEPEMTFDEKRDDYQAKFDLLYDNPNARWLDWSPVPEYMVFVEGPKGKRAAWYPISYEDELLADLKQRFKPLVVPLNPTAIGSDSTTNFTITDGDANIEETEFLSAGTQLDYPNYKSRSVLLYEMQLNGKTLHFSTTDKDRHDLRLRFSDNLFLTTKGGEVWLIYEGVLYLLANK